MTTRVRTPAKVNLCLRVGPLRSDGFHRVTTLFQAIDLYDELEIEPAGEVVVEGFDDTLVRRALAALGETRRVRLRKHIPVAGGLGGGSSDAAAVLRALRGDRSPNELHRIARSLGADVPFFLSGAEAALGSGRGDRIQPLPDFPGDHAFVLVPHERGLSTGKVYAATAPNELFLAVQGELFRRAHTARRPDQVAALMANDLEAAVLRLRPDVARALESLRGEGALRAMVSGSGPTAFGLFPDRDAADAAAAAIPGALAAAPVVPGAVAASPV
jgi:4-diphosphocytidyl-2-C-methyl-D-erythritol kinase